MCSPMVISASIAPGNTADIFTNDITSTDPKQALYPGGQENLGTPYFAHRPFVSWRRPA